MREGLHVLRFLLACPFLLHFLLKKYMKANKKKNKAGITCPLDFGWHDVASLCAL